jgi:uncharacterized protein (DUF362 family)
MHAPQGPSPAGINRRDFLKTTAAAGAVALTGVGFSSPVLRAPERSTVWLVKGTSRAAMIPTLLSMFGESRWKDGLAGKKAVLKPNFNSAHAFPGSTHPETLGILLGSMRAAGPAKLTLFDRSGMGDTAKVMRDLGAPDLASKYSADMVPNETLKAEDFVAAPIAGGHWSRGVEWPRLLADADAIVQTCCLKTHQYGGHFTLSLKNTVGMVAKFATKDQYNYMRELHSSPHQRRMIAEINALYQPTLVIMDAMTCFTDGGPHEGPRQDPGVILASTDRVALDAVGVAILRSYGTNATVGGGRIFAQEQLARAIELGLGVTSADRIDIRTPDAASEEYAAGLRTVLQREG